MTFRNFQKMFPNISCLESLGKHASVTCEHQCREPLVAWALGDKQKERLHRFHTCTTIWMPGTLVIEYM